MPTVAIRINGAPAGPNTDLPIDTLVTLTNNDNTGVTTWAWTFVDKPAGSLTTLSGANTSTATFTPDSEGTYLVQLVVNALSATPATGREIGAVLQLKTQIRIPAAQETTQAGLRGWATSVNETLQSIDNWRANPDVLIATINPAEPLPFDIGSVFSPGGVGELLTGLPGAQPTPLMGVAAAASLGNILSRPLYVLVATTNGAAPSVGALCLFMRSGLLYGLTALVGAVLGNSLYVNDDGELSLTPGTWQRLIGIVANVGGGLMDIVVDGTTTWDDQQFRNVAVSRDVLLNAGGALDQRIVKEGGTGEMQIGTLEAEPLVFLTDNTPQWQIQSDGTLASFNSLSGETIDNVRDPTNALQAANKNYVDTRAARSLIVFGCGNTGNAPATTTYLYPGYSPSNASPASRPIEIVAVLHPVLGGTAVKMVLRSPNPNNDDDITFTLNVNGVASALTVVMPAAATDAEVEADVNLGDGDRLSLSATSGAALSDGQFDVTATIAVLCAVEEL